MNIILESDRLTYRKMSHSDFETFCTMDLDPEVMKYYTSRPHGTREAAQASFQRYLDYHELFPKLGAFMVFDKFTNEFIGLGVLIHLELNTKSDQFETGYRLPVKSWNKGFATEICKTMLNYASQEIGLKKVYGTTHPKNVASQKVLLKNGFKEIGISTNYGGSTLFLIEI